MRHPIALFVSLASAASACSSTPSVKKVVDKPAVLEFFVMSQCPYGVQVMNAIAPVVEKLGPNLEFRAHYIVEQNGDAFTSMHGPKEVTGDIAQLCAQKLAPAGAFMKFVTCQNKAMQDVDTNWKACGAEAGIDAGLLASCIEGEDGKKLLASSFEAARERNARGSPTIFLNGNPYQGGRKSNDFLKAVCNEYPEGKPEACTQIPTAPKVAAIFFSDTRCPDCDLSPLEGRLRSVLGGLEVKRVDYINEEGKKLYAELRQKDPGFKLLPAILFDASLEKDAEGQQELARWLRPVAEYKSLAIGAKFDPTAEICDNDFDDDGNGKTDCADPGCATQIVCRTEKPKHLDLFVMSQCPYGAKAVTAMQEVVANFRGDLDLAVHFIGEVRDDGLQSMHGPAEVDEDVRQACAIKHYGKNHKYMDYLACRAADYRSTAWEACTGKNGIDAKVLQKCFDSEGKALLKKEFELARDLGVEASPTFLANNKHLFNGIDAETIKNRFCEHNAGLKGCTKTLSSDTSVQGSCK